MNNNGALRKVMFIVLLSILGSYCIGSVQQESASQKSQKKALKAKKKVDKNKSKVVSTVELGGKDIPQIKNVASITDSENNEAHDLEELFENKKEQAEDAEHGNNYACTDDRVDCIYNEEFFNDTVFTGKLDEDYTTFLDPDTRPMLFFQSSLDQSPEALLKIDTQVGSQAAMEQAPVVIVKQDVPGGAVVHMPSHIARNQSSIAIGS